MIENSAPRIAIVGYGSMGREVEKIAREQGLAVTDIFDVGHLPNDNGFYDFDVAIDFSIPSAVENNIRVLSSLGKNVVLGTTGWSSMKDTIFDIARGSGIGLVHSSNFSVGMQMFFQIVSNAASLIDKIDSYDVMIHELHHRRKIDSPSGTALQLGNIILKNVGRKKRIDEDTSRGKIDPEALHVTSTRGGEITGIHTVYIDSGFDAIELTHRAKNRSGFALGAVSAAKWIFGKKGIYDFRDVLQTLWNDHDQDNK